MRSLPLTIHVHQEGLTLRQCEKVVLRQLAEEAAREKAVSFDDRMKMWDRSDLYASTPNTWTSR